MLLNNKQDREAVGEQTPRFHSHWGSCVNQSGRPAGGPVWTLKADAFKFETIPCYSMQFFIDSVVVFFCCCFLPIIILPLGLSLALLYCYMCLTRSVTSPPSACLSLAFWVFSRRCTYSMCMVIEYILSQAGGVSWLLCHYYKSWQTCLGSGVPELPGSIKVT